MQSDSERAREAGRTTKGARSARGMRPRLTSQPVRLKKATSFALSPMRGAAGSGSSSGSVKCAARAVIFAAGAASAGGAAGPPAARRCASVRASTAPRQRRGIAL